MLIIYVGDIEYLKCFSVAMRQPYLRNSLLENLPCDVNMSVLLGLSPIPGGGRAS